MYSEIRESLLYLRSVSFFLHTTDEKFTFFLFSGYNGLISNATTEVVALGAMKRDSPSNFGDRIYRFQIGSSVLMIFRDICFRSPCFPSSLLLDLIDGRDVRKIPHLALPQIFFFSSPCTSAPLRYPISLSTFV